jgi:hypothetical protein
MVLVRKASCSARFVFAGKRGTDEDIGFTWPWLLSGIKIDPSGAPFGLLPLGKE